jgi:hypothetical protein
LGEYISTRHLTSQILTCTNTIKQNKTTQIPRIALLITAFLLPPRFLKVRDKEKSRKRKN